MHWLGPRALGWLVLILFGLLGAFTLLSPGSLRLQRPEGGWVPWAYNVLNLAVILGVTPLVGVLLLEDVTVPLERTSLPLGAGPAGQAVETIGIGLFVAGHLLQYWSRIVLSRSFRLGAVRPRDDDCLIERGPYRWVRHPMYTAVLAMALGLGLSVQSWPLLVLVAALAALIGRLIAVEEKQLLAAYGDDYERYRNRTRKLVPLLY